MSEIRKGGITAFPQINNWNTRMKTSRRTFMITTLGIASSMVLANKALADAAAVSESDPVAQALGYKADAAKVDKAKQPKYAAGQDCGNCSFYQGQSGSASAPCPMFAGKQVSAKGWCNAYNKKA